MSKSNPVPKTNPPTKLPTRGVFGKQFRRGGGAHKSGGPDPGAAPVDTKSSIAAVGYGQGGNSTNPMSDVTPGKAVSAGSVAQSGQLVAPVTDGTTGQSGNAPTPQATGATVLPAVVGGTVVLAVAVVLLVYYLLRTKGK